MYEALYARKEQKAEHAFVLPVSKSDQKQTEAAGA